jgi:ABC-type ATPase involved in cell division
MPKYPNILFIEGIAGGGKSTLLKLITKILFD